LADSLSDLGLDLDFYQRSGWKIFRRSVLSAVRFILSLTIILSIIKIQKFRFRLRPGSGGCF